MYNVQSDARFMLKMGMILLVMSVLAFSPRYFLPLLQAEIKPSSLWMHAHALFSMLWLGVFILQPWLITANKVALHRKIGRFALVIALGNLTSGLTLQLLSLPVATASDVVGPAFRLFQSIPTFILFLALALYYRRNTAFHLRYMYQTAFAGITSVLDRLFSFYTPLSAEVSGPLVGLTGLGFMLALPLYDKLKYKKVHKASWIGLLAYVLFQVAVAGLILKAPWWIAFATGASS